MGIIVKREIHIVIRLVLLDMLLLSMAYLYLALNKINFQISKVGSFGSNNSACSCICTGS